MKVKDLIKLLKKLNPDYVIDIASDEEGNSFGDIDDSVSEGVLKNGQGVYSLYPYSSELPTDRYQIGKKYEL